MTEERSPRYDEQAVSEEVGQAHAYTQLRTLVSSHNPTRGEDLRGPAYSPIQRVVIMRSTKMLSVIANVFIFAIFWKFFYPMNTENRLPAFLVTDFIANLGAVIWFLYTVIIVSLGHIYHAYETGLSSVSEIVYSQFLANLFASVIIYILACLIGQYVLNPLPLLVIILAQGIWSVLWSLMANKLYFSLFPPQRTAILYKQDGDLRKIEQIKHFPSRFDVQKHIMNPDDIDLIIREIDGNEAVFIVGIDTSLRDKIINHCIDKGILCYIVPQVGDVIMAGAEHMQMFSTPIMRVHRPYPSPEYLFIKRTFDIVGSLFGIIIAGPFMLLTALAIKVYDGGPVLYKQVRLTQGRREFLIWKFRSMCVDAEKDGVARMASACDDRITPVGKIIRAIRFDELPQMFNILSGDMTIVGPRPERPELIKQYEEAMPDFVLRLQVKAGLTGYAQIYGKYNTEPEDKLQMDLMYINNMSPVEDLRLMFATVKVLFMKESTQGVAEGQTTAAVENKEGKSA